MDPENRAIPMAAPQAPVPGRRRRPGASAWAPKAPTWAPKAPTGHQAAQMWLPWYHYPCWVLADGLDSATLTCPSYLPDLSCPAFPSCFGGLSGPLASDNLLGARRARFHRRPKQPNSVARLVCEVAIEWETMPKAPETCGNLHPTSQFFL